MRRCLAIGAALLFTATLSRAHDEPRRGQVLADHLVTVADDFIVDVYHNGLRVPDDKRTLLEEKFGATVERIDVVLREGDWLVFNVVNNRLRWGGCSYFAVTGRGNSRIGFTTELASGRWSSCDDLNKGNNILDSVTRSLSTSTG